MADVPVQRPADVETTVRGAGVLAAIGAGLFADLAEAAALWQLVRLCASNAESSGKGCSKDTNRLSLKPSPRVSPDGPAVKLHQRFLTVQAVARLVEHHRARIIQ